MKPMTLEESQIAVTIPGLDEELLLRSVKGKEEVGRLFEYELDILCNNHAIKHLDVLGQNTTVSVAVPDADPRFFNGHVAEFTYAGTHSTHGTEGNEATYARYRATIRPWLWFLTRRADCRIYQNMNAPDIIEETLNRHGFVDFQNNLTSQYEDWEYCVQYRETDFGFVTRLMEHEGIYYYHEHEDGKHTVVLCDGDGTAASRPAADGYEEIPYHIYDPTVERVFAWSVSQQVGAQAVGLKDFNFTGPRSNLSAAIEAHPEYVPASVPSQADLEIFDYPGKYETAESGDAYARMRMEEHEGQYEAGDGQTNARMVAVGGLFAMTGHPRAEENREYMVLSATYDLHWAVEDAQSREQAPVFMCHFRAMDAKRRYRLPRITARSIVQGPQTAIVVGPSGEKVWPDNYGRVKVQFHWDRYGKNDESSSCWIRVAQGWAGANWGGMHIPHIGQEVIVEFLEGDPDRPLITGRVYNAANMPPLTLPDNKHKSILSDDFGNQIVFDATPGDEHIAISTPHHDSLFQIGKSVKSYSDSDMVDITNGNQFSFGFGTKIEAYVGHTLSVDVGYQGSLSLAMKCDVFAGGTYDFDWGAHLGWNKFPVWQTSDSEYMTTAAKDYILGAGDDMCLAANLKEPKVSSIIRMEKDLVMSVGDGPVASRPGESAKWADMTKGPRWHISEGKQVALMAAAIATGGVVSGIGLSDWDSDDGKVVFGIAEASTFAVSVMAMVWLWNKTKNKNIEPVKHSDPKAEITLTRDGEILIEANGGKGLAILTPKDVSIVAKNIKLFPDGGEVSVTKFVKVSERRKTFKIRKYKLDHPSLLVQ